MSNFYLIYGIDNGLIKNKEKEILKKINISLINKYDLEVSPVDAILEDALTMNLFADKKVIIIENAYIFGSSSDQKISDRFLEYFNTFNSSTYIIFELNVDKVDSRKKITKKISEIGKVFEVKKLETNDLFQIIEKKFKDNNYTISTELINYLVSLLNDNYENINNELDKIFLLGKEDKNITKEDLDGLIIPSLDDDIFSLIDAITNKDKNKSIKLYQEFINRNEDMIKIIYLLASKYRLMLQVRLLSDRGYLESDIAKTMQIHPYRAKMVLREAYKYELGNLIKILKELDYLDRDIKLGNVDKNLALEVFLLKI